MFASLCRRRFLRLRQIPSAAGTNPSRPNPSDALLSHGGYSSSTLAGGAVSEPCPATISYLISCGLSPAAAATHMLRIRSTNKADAVRALLRGYGFTDADITEIVRRASLILTLDPDRILRSKLDFFAALGIKPRKLATTPLLLTRSLDKHVVPCVKFLRGILGTDGDLCYAITRTPRALMADLEKNMRPAVDALHRLGLPEKSISKLIILEMGVLMVSTDRISQVFEDVKALGQDVTDTGFLYSFRALLCLSRETWLRKVALYRSFGVSEAELRMAFKRQPTILLFSGESIKKKLRFFLDELKLQQRELMVKPVLLASSLEKTIIPRCAVLSVLMREGVIDPNIKLASALLGSAKMFTERFVLRYAHDVPDVVKAYEGKIPFEGFRDQDALVLQKQ